MTFAAFGTRKQTQR